MNLEEFAEHQALIEDKLEGLRKAVQFLYKDYHYHDSNNEMEILNDRLSCLLKAKENLKSTNDSYEDLLAKLDLAKQKRSEALKLLENAKIEEANLSDDIDKDYSEEENA